MKTVIEKIKTKERTPAILRALLEIEPNEYDNAHKTVDDTDVNQIGILISKSLNVRGVDNTLATGGLVFLYQLVTDCEKRRGLPEQLLDDLGVSKTQTYRCVDVWNQFGEQLLNSPDLKAYFVVEALKRLAAVNVNPLAREAAFQMAYGKQKVRISDADQLIAEFSSEENGVTEAIDSQLEPRTSKPENPQSLRGKKSSKPATIWEYSGKAIRFVLKPAVTRQTIDHEAVIKDMEAALDLYRQEYTRNRTVESEHSTQRKASYV